MRTRYGPRFKNARGKKPPEAKTPTPANLTLAGDRNSETVMRGA